MRTLNEARLTHPSGKDKIRKALSPEYYPQEQFFLGRENIHHGMEHISVVDPAKIEQDAAWSKFDSVSSVLETSHLFQRDIWKAFTTTMLNLTWSIRAEIGIPYDNG
jgi:hypothetical protein